MAAEFDPYHKWLGIPPAEQPPNFYRLLALNPFESDPDVIDGASDARTVHLRSMQSSQHGELTQKLLNEIADARLCLLNPDKKASYDDNLRGQMARTRAAQAPPPVPIAETNSAQATTVAEVPAAAESASSLLDFISAADQPGGAGVSSTNRLGLNYEASGSSTSKSRSARSRKAVWPQLLVILGPVIGIAVVAAAIMFRNSQDADDFNTDSNGNSATGATGPRMSGTGSESASGARPTVKPRRKVGEDDSLAGSPQGTSRPVAYLDDMPEHGVTIGYGAFGKHGWTGYPKDDVLQRVRLDGKDVAHALSMHPPRSGTARVSYTLAGKYQSFTALAVIMGSIPQGRPAGSQLQFRVLGDAKILWSSPKALQWPGERQECMVSVRGVMVLTLEVSCPGDAARGHAAWIEPTVSLLPPQRDLPNGGLAIEDPNWSLPTVSPADSGPNLPMDSSKPNQPRPAIPQTGKPAVETRSPVPDAAAQQKLFAQLKEVLKDDYAKSSSPEGRLALAQKLANLAGDEKDNSMRYVMATQSLDLAVKFGEAHLASDLVGGLSKFYAVDSWDLKAKTLTQLSHSCKAPEARAEIAHAALDLADKAAADDRWDIASALAALTVNLSATANAPALRDQARAAIERIRHAQKLADEVNGARKKLADSADDPDANLIVGRFLCLQRGDWIEGLAFLAKGSDPFLREIAGQEQSSPGAPMDQVNLADAWWNAADNRPEKKEDSWFKPMRARAVYWYRTSAPGLKGLALVKAQKRIAEFEPAN